MSTRFDTFVLEIEWDRPSPDSPKLPGLVGPFATDAEAREWATLNVVNGSWNVAPLAYPYYVPASSEREGQR